MVMQNSVLDPHDQRKTSSMEDSTAITIEFLRARLLSERSISRSARQRADELAKKVTELEEQLRMVTLQRKMAEKATADVLAILENHGITDVSEEFESGSDLDIPCESGVNNDSANNGGRFMSSKERRHGSDELSGSDLDSSSLYGSLSWKGRHDSPRSLENYKTSNFRRQTSFASISSSSKHRLGKSCRKIRCRQNRSVVEESGDNSIDDNYQENEVVSSFEGFPNCSDRYGIEKDMEKALEHQAQLIDEYEAMEKAQTDWEEKFRENNSTPPDSCDWGNHSDMDEQKDESRPRFASFGKLVNSNAQDDKAESTDVCFFEKILRATAKDTVPKSFDGTGYNNQNSPTFSSSDFFGQENLHSQLKGNQNEGSENHHYSSKKHNQEPYSHHYPDSKQRDKAEPTDVCFFEKILRAAANDTMPESFDGTGGYNNRKCSIFSSDDFFGHENSHSQLKGNHSESSVDYHYQSSDMHHQEPYGHHYPDSKQIDYFPTDALGGLHQKEASRNKNDLYALVSHEQSHKLSGILGSLKQAKTLLQQELNNRLPHVETRYTGKAFKSPASVSKSENIFHSPVGCSGLFRLPKDFSHEATARFNVHDSASGLSSNFYLDRGISRTSGVQLSTNPYSGKMLSLSADEQSLANQYLQNGSRFDSRKHPF